MFLPFRHKVQFFRNALRVNTTFQEDSVPNSCHESALQNEVKKGVSLPEVFSTYKPALIYFTEAVKYKCYYCNRKIMVAVTCIDISSPPQ